MKKHVRVYRDYFGLGDDDIQMCEYCHRGVAVDIHHIEPRGMGGSKDKDYIENLIGLCRPCHEAAEAKKIPKEALKTITEIRSGREMTVWYEARI